MNSRFLKLAILSIMFIAIVGCEKEYVEEEDVTSLEYSYLYQEKVRINSKSSNAVRGTILVKSDNKSLVNQNLELVPIYELEEINSQNSNDIEFYDDGENDATEDTTVYYIEEVNTVKPEVLFILSDIELPTDAVGFEFKHDGKSGWDSYYLDPDSGAKGIGIKKTNGKKKGKVIAEVGVIENMTSSFNLKIRGKIKNYGGIIAYDHEDTNYYLLIANAKNKRNATHTLIMLK